MQTAPDTRNSSRMNSILRLIALVSFAVVPFTKADETKKHFVVEAWYIVVPEAKALALQEKLLDIGSEEKVCDELIATALKGEAQIVSHLRWTAENGETARISEVMEKRYPTEFETPQLPSTAEEAKAFKDEWMVITPTTFEIRLCGPRIELTSTSSADGTVTVKGESNHVRFLGMDKFECFKTKAGFVGTIEQPKFHVIQNQMSAVARLGERILVGTNRVPEPTGHWEFCVIRVSGVKAREGEKK